MLDHKKFHHMARIHIPVIGMSSANKCFKYFGQLEDNNYYFWIGCASGYEKINLKLLSLEVERNLKLCPACPLTALGILLRLDVNDTQEQ